MIGSQIGPNIRILELLDDYQVGPDLPLRPGSALAVAKRLDVLQGYDQRVPVDLELATRAPLAAACDLDQPANLCSLLYVCNPPCWPSLSSSRNGRRYTLLGTKALRWRPLGCPGCEWWT